VSSGVVKQLGFPAGSRSGNKSWPLGTVLVSGPSLWGFDSLRIERKDKFDRNME